MQISLNAEEGLYWYHLIRAVGSPKSAKAWLRSSFFLSWIAVTILAFTASFCAIFIGNPDHVSQMARQLVVGGIIELMYVLLSHANLSVLCSASSVLWKFPAFLQDVKSSGASPRVRARLHFYHGLCQYEYSDSRGQQSPDFLSFLIYPVCLDTRSRRLHC
jgi:hypothetical protein